MILNMQKSQQHQEFPSGLPSKYYPGPMLLNFSDRTRTGVFNMVWTLTRSEAKYYLFKQNIVPCRQSFSTLHCILFLKRKNLFDYMLWNQKEIMFNKFKRYIFRQFFKANINRIIKNDTEYAKKPTAPGVPKRSPI